MIFKVLSYHIAQDNIIRTKSVLFKVKSDNIEHDAHDNNKQTTNGVFKVICDKWDLQKLVR